MTNNEIDTEGLDQSFNKEKQRKYRKTTNRITSDLGGALILYNLKTGNNGQSDIRPLSYDDKWKIVFNKSINAPKKGAVDVGGEIQNINIVNIRSELYKIIDHDESITEEDKKLLKAGIDDFIIRQFSENRRSLEQKKHLLHKKFRHFYTKYASEKTNLTEKEQNDYRDICLTLANMLYSKDIGYLDSNGEINQKGLNYIGQVFLKALKNVQTSGSSKGIHKIFHDGDFNFLRKETSSGKPIIGTLDHYVQAIMYLMDNHSYNAYNDGGDEGENERYKTKKLFLNNLYATAYLEGEQKKEAISDKGIIHKKLAEIRSNCKDSVGSKSDWDFTSRLKTEASKILKIGGRTKEIKDESGIRATYYGECPYENKEITISITDICRKYLEQIGNIDGITIESIQLDRKGDFITEEDEKIILENLKNILAESQTDSVDISKRLKGGNKKSILESISSHYTNFTKKKPSKGLQQAYRIANGEIKRGANGKYEDFKLIVKYSINKEDFNEGIDDNRDKLTEDISLYQEISFYPHTNDLDIGNHNFLDLEKRIFNRVKNMNDPELGKSISLHRLRYFTESALKDISFDIDIYEDKIKKGILPKPSNNDYKYLSINSDKKISLEGLVYRNQKNSKRFDQLITMILNYFIKSNKIFYINKEGSEYYGPITQEHLHDKRAYKSRRFTTSDVLRNTALDPKNENYSICFYTEDGNSNHTNFHSINLGDLGDFIGLERLVSNRKS